MAIYNKFYSNRISIYDDIVTLIKNNGWTDISSKPATDFNVFYSAGTSGSNAFYFQMIPYTNGAGYGIQTSTAYGSIQVNLRGVYAPGAPGVAGTFERTSGTCVVGLIRTLPAGVPKLPLIIWYDITLDHISIIVEEDTNSRCGFWMYIGLPSRQLITESSKSGLILAASSSPTFSSSLLCNYTPEDNAVVETPIQVPDFPKSKTLKGNLVIGEIAYGNPTTGIRGVLDDIYFLVDKPLLEGDTITLSDGRVFRFMASQSTSYVSNGTGYACSVGSLPSYNFAFRIA